jgi:prephenate dehydrogenase
MAKPMFEKVTIVGVGLIGGSLGLAIRKRGLARLVMGVVRRRKSVSSALKSRAVQGATMNLREGVRGADLVLLCSPVSTILEQMKSLKKFLDPGALVIDVASTKTLISKGSVSSALIPWPALLTRAPSTRTRTFSRKRSAT